MSAQLGFFHVTKRFGGHTVFENFTLALPTGKVSCLMGPSGSGKTTLLRMLMGLERPDGGKISAIHPQSVVFQEDRLLEHLSAPGNLRMLTGRARQERGLELLDRLGLGDALDKPVRSFSGGMKRRVAIARALLADYELLLMDEPFKGLDASAREQAARIILDENAGRTLVLVTHDKVEASLLGAQVFELPKVSVM